MSLLTLSNIKDGSDIIYLSKTNVRKKKKRFKNSHQPSEAAHLRIVESEGTLEIIGLFPHLPTQVYT